jgi:hypothetical protein
MYILCHSRRPERCPCLLVSMQTQSVNPFFWRDERVLKLPVITKTEHRLTFTISSSQIYIEKSLRLHLYHFNNWSSELSFALKMELVLKRVYVQGYKHHQSFSKRDIYKEFNVLTDTLSRNHIYCCYRLMSPLPLLATRANLYGP